MPITYDQASGNCQRWAASALNIQNACNLSGVVHDFSLMITDMWDVAHFLGRGTDWVNHCPPARLFAYKCAAIAGIEPFDAPSKEYYAWSQERCEAWAKGVNEYFPQESETTPK